MSLGRRLHLFPRRAVIFLVELYRSWISPMRMPTCRFEPTCSAYAIEALDRHGFLWGSVLSVWRLLKCGPWHKPGYDPVPETGPAQWFGRQQKTSITSAAAADDPAGAATSDRGK
ncbi:membrane protein insertion efficiency factor YidD [Gordonia sp. VNK21]|uniref:membrane protein insertion efficiency factor YidD n=1 Tax=Gordonia sp. VNK21 TaxID=3382483 RepID=UPI0038D4E74F